METDVKNSRNETVGVVSLSEAVFGQPLRGPLLHEVVRMQRASMRQGTAATKTKGLVSGGGKKPWKQKGTGRARAGSSRSPIWRGGGTTFGPVPRGYGYSMPKKAYRAALLSALSDKAQSGQILILEEWGLEEAKTKRMVELLKALQISGNILVVVPGPDEVLARATGNLPSVQLIEARQLNVYDLLWAGSLLTTRTGIEAVETHWGALPGGNRGSA
jgi:large subunit ribosomal protein L4